MDEGMLDSEAAMVRFLNLIAAEPDIARVPIMIDSSKWTVIEAGLKCVQGKAIVNSISLKEGEDAFIEQARKVRAMARRSSSWRSTRRARPTRVERKVEICKRSYGMLTREGRLPGRGHHLRSEHLRGRDRHRRAQQLRAWTSSRRRARSSKACPHAQVSGGVSNVSFSFRGNDAVREAMHSVFLYHAITAGMDMGIVNAGQLAIYEEIEPELLERVEDVILNRRPDATERLLEIAGTVQGRGGREDGRGPRVAQAGRWRSGWSTRWSRASTSSSIEDTEEARLQFERPLARHRRPADGRHERRRRPVRLRQDVPAAGGEVGPRDEEGRRVPGAVHRGARRPRRRVAPNGKIVMATVKGDVHDIGKNIVGVVLRCNNYEVIDLGVMVPCEKILETARREDVDIIGLSGLITPSLDEMVHVAREMQRQGFDMPLLIGGATTSPAHTSVKIEPQYEGAGRVREGRLALGGRLSVAGHAATRAAFVAKLKAEHASAANSTRARRLKARSSRIAQARANSFRAIGKPTSRRGRGSSVCARSTTIRSRS